MAPESFGLSAAARGPVRRLRRGRNRALHSSLGTAGAPSVDFDAATCKETSQSATDRCESSADACLADAAVEDETCPCSSSERMALVDDCRGDADGAKQHDCAFKCPCGDECGLLAGAGQSASPPATPLMECNQSKCSTSSLAASEPSVDCDAATCKETGQCATDTSASSVDEYLADAASDRTLANGTVEHGPGQVPKLPPRLGGNQPGYYRPPADEAGEAVDEYEEALDDDTEPVEIVPRRPRTREDFAALANLYSRSGVPQGTIDRLLAMCTDIP